MTVPRAGRRSFVGVCVNEDRLMAAMTMNKIRRLFSMSDIAEIVGDINEKTVRSWADQDLIRSVKLPGSKGERRVHREDLRAFLNEYGYWWAIRELDEEEGKPPHTEPEADTPPKPPRRKRD
jgi:hypothetical protein